jgi:hypothetical protein
MVRGADDAGPGNATLGERRHALRQAEAGIAILDQLEQSEVKA